MKAKQNTTVDASHAEMFRGASQSAGDQVLAITQGQKTGKPRRPFMCMLTGSMTRENAVKALGQHISRHEWALAQQHCIFPGVGQPVAAVPHSKLKVDKE
jgi:hypothetical protein